MDKFSLINMNGRLYDPEIGRMLSPDNYVQAPGFTQSFNRYSYCLNNPLKYTDPTGNSYVSELYHNSGGGSYVNGFGMNSNINPYGHDIDFSAQEAQADFYFGWANLFYNGVTKTSFGDYYSSGGKYERNGSEVTTYSRQDAIDYFKYGYTSSVTVDGPITAQFLGENGGGTYTIGGEGQDGGGDYVNQYGNPSATLDQFANNYKGKTENQIVFGQSSFLGYKFPNDINKKYRFVSIGNGREVDMIHFMVVGRRGYLLGYANEIKQALSFSSSAFYPQDLYSNKLGINFFDRYGSSIQQNPTKISEYINWYLSNPANW